MPKAGDSFIATIKKAHLEWGTHRYTSSRGIIYGEGYIQISANNAYIIKIFNGNYGDNALYNAISYDGFFEGQLLTQGNQDDDRYAKQFSVLKNLKALGSWYADVNAVIGDFVKVKFISDHELEFEHSTTKTGFHI